MEFVKKIFNDVRAEFFHPPIYLKEVQISDKLGDKVSISIKNGLMNVTIGEEFLKIENHTEIFKWLLRHYFSHIHYCPYDLKTAYQLEREAYKVLGNWYLAFLAFRIFSDLMIDLLYLPRRFLEIPGHLEYLFREKPKGINLLFYSAYQAFYKDHVPQYELETVIENAGYDMMATVYSTKPWIVKQRIIAAIIRRSVQLRKKIVKGNVKYSDISSLIPIIEDVKKVSSKELYSVYGSISSEEEAKAFYSHWIKDRVEDKRIYQELEKSLKSKRGKKKVKGKRGREAAPETGVRGEEPILSTSLAKPVKKLGKKLVEEAAWKRHWYKARAERILVEFIAESKYRWAHLKEHAYPETWYLDDEIEDLDLELTTADGPFIPEVTTSKWVLKRLHAGSIITLSPVPDLIVVLDSSKSMASVFNDAALAAFIIYNSAKRSGNKVAVVNFSTQYLYGDWDESDDLKETILSIFQGQYTIFPYPLIDELVRKTKHNTFILVITDGGWQNLPEAITWLKKARKEGHETVIIHVYSWRYDKNIEILSRKAGLKIIEVKKPEVQLKRIALTQAKRFYIAPSTMWTQ